MSIPYEQPAKCTSKGDGGEKERDAINSFVPLVPHAQIIQDSRNEPGFCHAEKEAGDEESGETLSETHEGTDDPPREGDSWKPKPWRCEFEDDISRDFEQDITDEVDGQCGEELVSGLHFEQW